jgi:hypothetical protein
MRSVVEDRPEDCSVVRWLSAERVEEMPEHDDVVPVVVRRPGGVRSL